MLFPHCDQTGEFCEDGTKLEVPLNPSKVARNVSSSFVNISLELKEPEETQENVKF